MPVTRRVFDREESLRINDARQAALRRVLLDLAKPLALRTSLDVGCGVGHFSNFLSEMGLEVVGVDARADSIAEAKRRLPHLEFYTWNIEDPALVKIGSFDLVLCVGLLYHLENPLRALRNLYNTTAKLMLVESLCLSGRAPILLLREETSDEDQSLTGAAFYPSEECLVSMCYLAGFPFVYRFQHLPDHDEFRSSLTRKRRRTMLAVSRLPLNAPSLLPARKSASLSEPWRTGWGSDFLGRLWYFLQKPWSEKLLSARRLLRLR